MILMIKTNNNFTRSVCLILVIAMMLSLLISCMSNEGKDEKEKVEKNEYRTGEYGYIDKEGNMVIEPQYPYANEFSEGLASVSIGEIEGSLGERWVYIDNNGEVEIDAFYESAGSFSEGLAPVWVESDEMYLGYIDREGNYVIEPERFRTAMPFSEGLARVSLGNTIEISQGFIDRTGEYVIPDELEGTETEGCFYNGRALIYNSAFLGDTYRIEYGYIDKAGAVVIEPQFEYAHRFSEGLAPVKVDGKWGYIDTLGNIVIEPQYEDLGIYTRGRIFSEGLAAVSIDGKWGYIDSAGNMIIEPQYDNAGMFSEGLAAVLVNEKWGYIDKNGNMIIEPQYADAGYFSEGLAPVKF